MMSIQPPLPHREAIVLVRRLPDGEFHPEIEIDPIELPVEMSGVGILADVFNADLLGLVDALCALDNDLTLEYKLVWSDGWADVRGCCALCDIVFPVAEGFPGDELNEGVNAVCCGCRAGQND